MEESTTASKTGKRIGSVFGGIGLILLGIVLLVLPGPGKLCILLGVVMVGEGLGFNTSKRLKEMVEPLVQRFKSNTDKQL